MNKEVQVLGNSNFFLTRSLSKQDTPDTMNGGHCLEKSQYLDEERVCVGCNDVAPVEGMRMNDHPVYLKQKLFETELRKQSISSWRMFMYDACVQNRIELDQAYDVEVVERLKQMREELALRTK